ncbi:MAG: peptidyl-prolyl cis-trans isomerase, partial [Alphaproteobacteria bacterium]|nr:peptidyl-prolyl cis-trans isomerase [Alphaproteobacteria bacterium]
MQSRLADQMFALSTQIDDGIAAGTPLEELSADLGLKLEKVGPVRADGSTSESTDGFKTFEADREQLLQTAFELNAEETSSVLEMKDGSFAVVRADNVTEKSYQPFDEVKADLAKVWMQDQREVLNKQRAEKALLRLQTGETTLDALATELKVKPRTLSMVRADTPEEPLNTASKTIFFEPESGAFALAPTDTGFVVGQVTKVTIPDVTKAKKEDLAMVRQNAIRSTQDEIFLMYLETLRVKYGVKINRNVLEQLYGQQANAEPTS